VISKLPTAIPDNGLRLHHTTYALLSVFSNTAGLLKEILPVLHELTATYRYYITLYTFLSDHMSSFIFVIILVRCHIIMTSTTMNIPSSFLWLFTTYVFLKNGCFLPSNRLPRRLLYGELLSGQRQVGRPKLRYSDHIKSMLRKCNIPESNLENLAADKESWRSTCAAGLKNLSAASEQVASDRRARRHAASQATPAGPACPQCGRICALDFGLRSHLHSHHRPQN